ncbi:MAG: FAD-binding oxidoreductase [Rhodobacteraceae bacterium]|nr:FAD-binding oxidoreductase [Paracoccaceae bacterium]
MARADVVVIGAGITGLAIAFECARRGARVGLAEAGAIGAGCSGGPVGALAPHAPEAGAGWTPLRAFQLASLAAGAGFWAAVAAAGGGDPGYGRTGRLQPLADAVAVGRARARVEAAAASWGGTGRLAVVPAPADGWPEAGATGLCLADDLTARLRPRRALAALAAAIGACGGEIATGRGEIEESPWPARAVVWATGWQGLARLSRTLGPAAGGPVKGQALELALPGAAGWPVVQAAGGLFIVPHAGGTVAVGSTVERAFADPFATDDRLGALHAAAVAACPPLAGAGVVARWAGLRPRAATGRPILGPWPGRPGHFVANGAFKTGFGLAPGIARTIADLVLEGRDAIPAEMRLPPPG